MASGFGGTGYDQAKTRRTQVFTDQHGRKWDAVIDLKNGDTVGPYTPHFKAPMMPHLKYIKGVKGEFGRIRIDYDQWLEDLKNREADYKKEMLAHAVRMYKDDAAAKVADPTPALLDAVGPPPPAWQPIDAARKGNKWVLGLVDQSAMPPWAEPFFIKPAVEETEYPDIDYEDATEEPHESWQQPKRRGRPPKAA